MNEIARFTTPSITFKPKMVEISAVDEIFIVIKQNGAEVIRKGINDATVTEDGFAWFFGQEDTALLSSSVRCTAQIDYTSGNARYTTIPKVFDITESAIEEVI